MINIEGLEFGYSRRWSIFKGLSMSQEKGRIVGLLGKNGAGKSTLLRLIVGLLHPDQGSVNVLGYRPEERNPDMLRRMFFICEEFDVPPIKIAAYLKANSPFYPNFDVQKFDEILKEFELDYDQRLDRLSFGQKKKFMICFALATNCELLVMDEPTNGLDIPSKSIFRKVVAGAVAEDQMVIISTHQIHDVEVLLDHLVLIENSKIMLDRSIADINEQYAFVTTSEGESHELLYSEPSVGGYRGIKYANGVSSQIDIELLFNAVIQNVQL